MATQTAPERPEMLGAVAAVVVAESAERLAACLSAVGRQVYGPSQLFVVGGGDRVRAVAGQYEALWRPHLRAVLHALSPEAEFIWLLRDAARPRPDALLALVRDGARAEAAVAGWCLSSAKRTGSNSVRLRTCCGQRSAICSATAPP